MLGRKIDVGEQNRIDWGAYDFDALPPRTAEQRQRHPKLELVMSRLGALKLLPGKPGRSGPCEPALIPDLVI